MIVFIFRSALLAKEKGDITQALSRLHELIEAVQKETSEDISPDFNCRYSYHYKDTIPSLRQRDQFFLYRMSENIYDLNPLYTSDS